MFNCATGHAIAKYRHSRVPRCNRGEHQAPYMMGRWPDRDVHVDSRYRMRWKLVKIEVWCLYPQLQVYIGARVLAGAIISELAYRVSLCTPISTKRGLLWRKETGSVEFKQLNSYSRTSCTVRISGNRRLKLAEFLGQPRATSSSRTHGWLMAHTCMDGLGSSV